MKSFCDIQDWTQNSNHSRKSPSHNAILEKGHPNVRRLSPLNSHCTGPNKEKISIGLIYYCLIHAYKFGLYLNHLRIPIATLHIKVSHVLWSEFHNLQSGKRSNIAQKAMASSLTLEWSWKGIFIIEIIVSADLVLRHIKQISKNLTLIAKLSFGCK